MKRILLIGLLSIGLIAAAFAQSPSASVLEMKYFAIESSIVIGYSMPAAGITTGSSFLLNVAVADNFTFGVQTTMLDTSAYTAMKLGYYLNDLLGFSATFGGDGTNAYMGAGAFVNLKKNVREAALSDAIKLRLEYIFPDTGIADGAILITAGFCLGL